MECGWRWFLVADFQRGGPESWNGCVDGFGGFIDGFDGTDSFDGFDGGSDGSVGGFVGLDGFDGGVVGGAEADRQSQKEVENELMG